MAVRGHMQSKGWEVRESVVIHTLQHGPQIYHTIILTKPSHTNNSYTLRTIPKMYEQHHTYSCNA